MAETVIPAPPLLNYSNKISKGLFDGSAGYRIDGALKGDFCCARMSTKVQTSNISCP